MRIHFLENTESNTQVFNVISQTLFLNVEPYLKMSSAMLFGRLRVPRRYDEIVDYNGLLPFTLCHVVFLLFIFVNIWQRSKIGEAIWS